MPLYDYKCNTCNHEFEWEITVSKMVHSKKTPIVLCPQCGKRARKLINKPAIVFKGAGFYSTDNKEKK